MENAKNNQFKKQEELLDVLEHELLTSMEDKVIQYLIKYPNRYFTKTSLYNKFNATSRKEKEIYSKIINNLNKKNIVFITKRKKVAINKNIARGRIYFSKEGRAFFNEGNGAENRILKYKNTMNSIHGDTVLIYMGTKEDKVIKVLGRKPIKIKGTYIEEKNGDSYVIADNPKIHRKIRLISKGNAKPYDKVFIKLYSFNYKNNLYADIVQTLGLEYEREMNFTNFLKDHKIRYTFPDKVLEEAKKVSKLDASDKLNRLDLTKETIFTIDGEDAKDLDDAISVYKYENGYKLGVHIADVSHYVKRNSRLDKEAYLRGTSVYLINKSVPMLPKRLSNGICSLFPNKERLTISIIFDIDKHGNIKKSNLYRSVIKSKAQLTYSFVQEVLDNPQKKHKESDEIISSILAAKELSDLLEKKRHERGAIDFDIKVPEVILDKNDNPISIKAKERLESNNIIQEFMLLANEDVAKRFKNLNVPFLFRVHPYPQKDKLGNFLNLMNIHGHSLESLDLDDITPEDIAKIVNSLNGDKSTEALKRHLLKSMKQARYSDIHNVHFGLASDGYCHFTSPIRRYPDLEIHRIIKDQIIDKNEFSPDIYNDLTINAHEIAKSCSNKERKAERAEEELLKIKIVDYMNKNTNEVFPSSIIDIQDNYLFLELDNAVEGYVYIDDLIFNKDQYKAYSKSIDKEFELGDNISVKPQLNKEFSDLQFTLIY